MEQVEPILVELCIRLGRARQPLKCKNFIPLANSLIKGTLTEKEIIAFKARYSYGDENAESAELGAGYYRGFENFCIMYDGVYDEMVAAGVAKHLSEKVWMDINGNVVSFEEEAFGMKVDTVITHHDYILFVDEVGSNTNQKNDGPIGGEKVLTERGTTPRQKCSTTDAHFTVLGFTAATGEPVMCVIIFEGEDVKAEWATGIDIQKNPIGNIGDVDFFEANSGLDKLLPSGPSCRFKGKDVPCLCYATPKGSITSEILQDCLKKMDELNLFPRMPGGPKPFLLLDGHGSRFELPFLEYINTPETEWFVCIGVPYGTSYWQVGDSSEQNGSFKMSSTIVNYAWAQSFARIFTNKKAIAARGWGPLNCALLKHPEIMESQIQTAPGSHQPLLPVQHATIPLDLNTTSGSSGEMFAIILREADREEHRRQREQQQEAAQERVKQVEEIKRLTAGVHFNSKKLRLGTTVLERVRAQQQKKEEAQLQKDKKKRAEQWARRRKAMEIRALNIPEDRWTKAQLKVMCTYKKHRGDTGLPDDIGLLRQVWKERQGRLSPTVSAKGGIEM